MHSVINCNSTCVYGECWHAQQKLFGDTAVVLTQIQLSKDAERADYIRKQAYFLYEVQRMLQVYAATEIYTLFL